MTNPTCPCCAGLHEGQWFDLCDDCASASLERDFTYPHGACAHADNCQEEH